MCRRGHSPPRAALTDQPRTSERDRLIAEAMSKLAEEELGRATTPSGTQRARAQDRAS